jgi:hypothetical protein
MWVKHREEQCPFLKDKSDVASEIEFLELLAAAGHSYVVKVKLGSNIYALKLVKCLAI